MVEPLAPDVVYELDSRDEIASVNGAWSVFAAENGGTSLLPPGIIGRSLWDFINDPTTRLVYTRLFSRVRSGAGNSTFAFRCDSPSVKRILQMEIATSGTGMLTCRVRTLSLEPRPAASILDPAVPRSTHLMIVCSWCKRVFDGDDTWIEIDDASALSHVFAEELPPQISHGMCGECYLTMMRSLEENAGVGHADQPTV